MKQCEVKAPGEGSQTSSSAARAPGKNRGGAPVANTNASRDPEFTRMMRARKEARREHRDKYRRAAERESRETLDAVGLVGHPLGRRIGRRLTDTESEIARLRDHVDQRGRLDREGALRPAYDRYLQLQREDRQELRQLLDRLSEIASQRPAGDVEYRCIFSDGTPALADAAPDRASGPESDDHGDGSTSAPSPESSPLAAVHCDETPAARKLDRQMAAAGVPKPARPLTRAEKWARGDDLW